MATVQGKGWSDKKKWIMYLCGSITTVILSITLSYFMAQGTAKKFYEQQSSQGELVLNSIGYRYFSSIAVVIDTSSGEFKRNKDDAFKKAYFETLRDIQEDLRWVQKNPVLIEGNRFMMDVPQLRVLLSVELSHKSERPLGDTMEIMCRSFVDSESWKEPLEKLSQDTFAAKLLHDAPEICRVLRNST